MKLIVHKRALALLTSDTLTLTPLDGVAHATTTDTPVAGVQVSEDSRDRVLLDQLEVLEQLPDEIFYADPNEIENFEQVLIAALIDLEPLEPGVPLAIDWGSCALQLGIFAVEYGIPVFKLVRAIRALYRLFGSFREIVRGFRTGEVLGVTDADTAETIQALFGIDAVAAACS